jgi:hypothetical protein
LSYGAAQFPLGDDDGDDVGEGDGEGEVLGGLLPANCTSNFVKSQSFWTTLLHVPDVVDVAPPGHSRSRFTDQNV